MKRESKVCRLQSSTAEEYKFKEFRINFADNIM